MYIYSCRAVKAKELLEQKKKTETEEESQEETTEGEASVDCEVPVFTTEEQLQLIDQMRKVNIICNI